jgi:sugar phosphate isomerase/epimerase
MVFPGHLWPADTDAAARRELRRAVDACGARIGTLSIANNDLNIASAYPGLRTYSLDLLSDIVRLAGDLGVPGVVIGPGKPNPLFPLPRAQLVGYLHAALDALCALAERTGTRICMENMPVGFISSTAELADALDAYGNDGIGFVYDVANGHFVREDVRAALQHVAARLTLLHLSDTNQTTYRHDRVGLGDVDFAVLPPVLAALGHVARPVLEVISTHPDRDIDASAARLVVMGWGGQAAPGTRAA